MAAIIRNFDAYRIWYYAGHPYEALIYCYQGGSYVGRMVFFKDDATIPPNANYSSGPSIHYALGRFDDVTETLRHESPLYLFLNPANMIGGLATSELEPTGEEEL